MVNKLGGYFKAVYNYLNADKTRHDIRDYFRAMLIMLAVMAALRFLLDFIH
jgi:hypothetical protein